MRFIYALTTHRCILSSERIDTEKGKIDDVDDVYTMTTGDGNDQHVDAMISN